jgi:phage pi2 protein 07
MKILVTESQYNKVISESNNFYNISVEEMEEKMKLFFTSADDYKRNLGMFIRLYFHLDLDNIDFTWYPQGNNENYARFQLKCHFPMDSRKKHVLQFSFTEDKKAGKIKGQFNGFLEVTDGMKIFNSLYIYNIQSMGERVYQSNMEDIRNYTKEFAKEAKRYIR